MSKLLENLNKEQVQAVTHGGGPLLIVAGAGTGKTTVITRRIAYLIEQGLAKPDEILALTFTEKAAGEMQERADQLLPLGYYDMWISTFHSFCERLLKNHALDIGLPNDFELLDEVRQWILVYKNFDKFDLDYYRPLGSPNRFIDALLRHFSRCKDELITPAEYLEYAESLKLSMDSAEGLVPKKKSKNKNNLSPTLPLKGEGDESAMEIFRVREVANAYHVYQKLLLDNNYLDFGDLINCALDLFQKRPKILKFYQNKFKYILVDEFQDTNFAQYQLVKLLTSGDQNLVVVGDDDQSIYKFRGASVSNILKFKEDFPNCTQITLLENYRSTQPILDLAYNFIQANNPDRLEVKLKIDKKLHANVGNGRDRSLQGTIEVIEADDLGGELHAVAKKILELKTNLSLNPSPQKGREENSWNDFAILIRANSAADELLPVLANHGIPYTFVANKGLYQKPIVLDVLSYMRLLDNAHDSQNLYRVLTLPKFRLSHQELSALLLYAKQKTVSMFEALVPAQALPEISTDSRQKIRTLMELLQKHSALAKTKTAAEIMVEIVAELELENKLKEETAETTEARELLEQFYKKIEEFEKQNSHRDLHSFLQSLDLELQAGSEGTIKFDPNLGPESLKVLTIHSAKGLEFTHVFLINMVDQRFPTRAKGEPIEIPKSLVKDILPEGDFHMQEERRLFYVAATRARKNLFFSWAKDYGGKQAKKPSQFLMETGLVPSEKTSKATGKVVFNNNNNYPRNKKQVYKSLPTKFSYTDLNTFESCPLEYKYRSYLKLPLFGTHHQSFGSTIHKTFEEFLKLYKHNREQSQTDLFGKKASDDPLPDFKFLEKLYQNNWIDDWYENPKQKEQYRQLGSEMLKAFYENTKTSRPEVKYIEQFFKLKLGHYDFVGKIDRADKSDGGLMIVDYKTGKTPKAKKDIDQLYIYQWAAENFLREKVNKLKYWYLQDPKPPIEEQVADQKTLTVLQAELKDIIDQIVDAVKYDRFKELDGKLANHDCKFKHLE